MKIKILGLIIPIFLGLVIGCETMSDDQLTGDQKSGTLTVRITDAPFPSDSVAEANITIDKVEIKVAGDGNMESDADSFIVLSEETATFNLLDLSNGVTEVLTTTEVQEGMYSEMRLHIVSASIKLTDGRSFDMKVPSGSASGLKIKINPSIEIINGMSGEILLDFDVSRSFKTTGSDHSKKGITGFHFSPVLRCVNSTVITSGIKGTITDIATTDSITSASIILFSGTDTITSAISSEKGYYEMLGIEPATYSMECAVEGYDTLRVDNVMVERGIVLEQNFVLEPKTVVAEGE